ncbi:MAG UNVERIFIED_CONTAM: BrnT family toxin [Microcystis novacekii LVE1205-3]
MSIQVIGIVNQVVLFVVYTKRNGRYRIISARRANKMNDDNITRVRLDPKMLVMVRQIGKKLKQ